MDAFVSPLTFCSVQSDAVAPLLESCGVKPTAQRLAIARVLAGGCCHWSAEQVGEAVGPDVSRATIYNTLNLFVEKGLLREVVVSQEKVFYDTNTRLHHHFYGVDDGRLIDIPLEQLPIAALPPLPDGSVLDAVDVVVRVRQA